MVVVVWIIPKWIIPDEPIFAVDLVQTRWLIARPVCRDFFCEFFHLCNRFIGGQRGRDLMPFPDVPPFSLKENLILVGLRGLGVCRGWILGTGKRS